MVIAHTALLSPPLAHFFSDILSWMVDEIRVSVSLDLWLVAALIHMYSFESVNGKLT